MGEKITFLVIIFTAICVICLSETDTEDNAVWLMLSKHAKDIFYYSFCFNKKKERKKLVISREEKVIKCNFEFTICNYCL